MSYRNDRFSEHSIADALETLSHIADLPLEGPLGFTEGEEPLAFQEMPALLHTVLWLHRKNAEHVMQVVRQSYRVILRYLNHFYKQEYGRLVTHSSVEGIKTIMVLVGESAQKLDKYTKMFVSTNARSVKESDEFRSLLTFYRKKIAPIAVQESLEPWIRLFPEKVVGAVSPVRVEGKKHLEHLFFDLEAVKRDSDYELFSIRKENGSRFFDAELVRNMKLACNFEEPDAEKETMNPLEEITVWQDTSLRLLSQHLLRSNWNLIDLFIKKAIRFPEYEPAQMLLRAIMALMLAAGQGSGAHLVNHKGSSAYFADFQHFYRSLLISSDYRKLEAYPIRDETSIDASLIELSDRLAKELFSAHHQMTTDFDRFIGELILSGRIPAEADVRTEGLVTQLGIDFEAFSRACTRFSHFPLLLDLELMQNQDLPGFDPLLQQSLPSVLFELHPAGKQVKLLRMPSPTYQMYTRKAHVTDEFTAFIRHLSRDTKRPLFLLLNFQDRANWREHARAHALEEWQEKGGFAKNLLVVSMAKDGDLYNQTGPYSDMNRADAFIDSLVNQVHSHTASCLLPKTMEQELGRPFLHALASAIHRLFFAEKNVLTRDQRLNFIEMLYLFLQLKIIEIVHPDFVGFTCKDGLDLSTMHSIWFFIALKLLNDRSFSIEEEQYVRTLAFGVPFMHRGRSVLASRFTRTYSAAKAIASTIDGLGASAFKEHLLQELGPLYAEGTLSSVIDVPHLLP